MPRKKKFKFKISNHQARFFANLFTNLAAGWFGAILITPNLENGIFGLTKSIVPAIVCSVIAIQLEKYLEKHQYG